MIENIKRIGLFMIVAQTLIHFAAGKQYEKYMKIIAGVIVVLLFVRPFSSHGMDFTEQWQREMERLTEQMEEQNSVWKQSMTDLDYGTESKIIGQFEEEIKERLSREVPLDNYFITDVAIKWESRGEKEAQEVWEKNIESIVITLQQEAHEDQKSEKRNAVDPVFIERIQVEAGLETEGLKGEAEWQIGETDSEESQRVSGDETEQEISPDKAAGKYRRRFAEVLKIEETQVEVVYGGGR